jgi:hypothetical protein
VRQPNALPVCLGFPLKRMKTVMVERTQGFRKSLHFVEEMGRSLSLLKLADYSLVPSFVHELLA